MKVIFKFLDVLEIVNDSLLVLDANSTKAQRTYHHELSKKDGKCLFLIHQYMDSNIYEKIIEQETINEA